MTARLPAVPLPPLPAALRWPGLSVRHLGAILALARTEPRLREYVPLDDLRQEVHSRETLAAGAAR